VDLVDNPASRQWKRGEKERKSQLICRSEGRGRNVDDSV
jgi:hypothetical protein